MGHLGPPDARGERPPLSFDMQKAKRLVGSTHKGLSAKWAFRLWFSGVPLGMSSQDHLKLKHLILEVVDSMPLQW